MAKKEYNLTELLPKLGLHSENEEHEKVLERAEQILKLSPDDKNALRAKVVAQIKLDQFEPAYKTFHKNVSLKSLLLDEYAYVLYKLERVDELMQLPLERPGVKHALAQALYKVDRFEESLKIYKDILSNTDVNSDDFLDIEVNLSAITSSRVWQGDKSLAIKVSETSSFYQLFNSATALAGKCDYERALKHLQEAKLNIESCGLSPEEAAAEIAPILVQAAYVNQLLNKTDEALSILKNLKSEGITDKHLARIVENNIISLTSDINEENPHIILAKLGEGDITRETILQQGISRYNQIILRSFAGLNSVRFAKKSAGKSESNTSGLDAAYLGVFDPSEEKLSSKQFRKHFKSELASEKQNASLVLILSQLYYKEGKIEAAATSLEDLLKSQGGEKYQEGIVGILANLYKLQNREWKGVELIGNALEKWAKLDTDASYSASLLSGFSSQEAAGENYFNQRSTGSSNNITNATGLIATGSSYEKKREAYAQNKGGLVPIETLSRGLDGNELIESAMGPFLRKRPSYGLESKSTSKKRKKAGKPPKDFDPSVPADPERWLPKRDRSTWKPKKKEKKGSSKSTQGGSIDNVTESAIQPIQPTAKVVKPKTNPPKKKKKGKK